MSKPKPPASVKAGDKDTLKVRKDPAQRDEAQIAGVALGGVAANALTARTFAAGTFGNLDMTECVSVLRKRADSTHAGDLRHAETTLAAQAATLDAIFNELARRAALNMGQHLDATERYMRLALKAQGQCRATLETLTTIKNPPVVFAKQANIAHGPQQVNNGAASPNATNTHAPAHARESEARQNELLEEPRHGRTDMDARATTTTARSNPTVEALETVHRATKSRR